MRLRDTSAAGARTLAFGIALVALTATSLESIAYWFSRSLPHPTRANVGTIPMIEPDPDTIWKFKPSFRFAYELEGRIIRSSTNSFGAHDDEWSAARLARENRALAIGNSFSFGWGVDLANVWWKQLGTRAPPGQLETFGAGYWFSTYDQQYLFLKRYFAIVRPRLVIAALFPPHVLTEMTRVQHFDTSGDMVRVTDPIIAVFDGTLTYSVDGANAFSPVTFPYLLSYPRRLLEGHWFEAHYRQLLDQRLSNELSYDDPLLESRRAFLQPGFEKLFTSLRLMHRYSREHGADFVAVILPAVGQILPNRLETTVSAHGAEVLASSYPQRDIAAFCRDQGIACLDLLPLFRRRADKDRLYLATDVHLSASGHRLVAESVAAFLSQNGADWPTTQASSGARTYRRPTGPPNPGLVP